ncbi:type IV secretory pathway VirD2 relaxase [Rhizomicrobium palustre]|uniref:Type IV secretory pathway VirD2 relaxase n=1 Tax=Rhizomicrobium palustre TaxID=189966 RepID=A0A846MW33_9PROT|nr:relaxase/mobilization nuclease RlxS [Rhizomicrobium palustre]NIK87563.1 type IV secretory pathway VirD2 relaxase [Rhizomicrobium palustre]
MRDDEFEPHLGKIGSRAPRERSYLQRVLHTANLAGRSAKGKGTFHGSRIGRGAGIGRVLAARDRCGAYRQRRVVTKSRFTKLAGKGLGAAKAHLRYIQRDGVTREGEPGQLYSAERDRVDGKEFLERCDGDRHQFRFIVAAEDAEQYEDLKPFIRRLMAQMEADLGTKLDWVAANHFNTGHPHTHIVLRGKDDKGEDLVIAREYISHGIRERAAEIVTLDLGPRTDLEIEDRLRREVEQERFTSLDRRLLKDVGDDGVVRSTGPRDPFQQTLCTGRLQKLKRLGLAEEERPGQWRLAPDLENTLRQMGERGDIIRRLHREMAGNAIMRGAQDYAIYDPAEQDAKPLIGRVVARGLSDEINDRFYLVVDAADGRAHYVEIGKADDGNPTREGSIIAVRPKPAGARDVDRTIADIASANEGRYSIDLHLRYDPSATQDFAETHVRRLEAMRRLVGNVERDRDGTWVIGRDHLENAAAFERKLARLAPVQLEILSTNTLDRQVTADGATWLDRTLVARNEIAIHEAGFGRDLNDALVRRRQWLIEEDLAREDEAGRTLYRANLLSLLRRRDLTRAAGQLSDELRLAYSETKAGDHIEGVYRRSVDLVSGRFAIVERSRDFTLVPWRPVLERNLGKSVSGIARENTISWSLGRQRSGPEMHGM